MKPVTYQSRQSSVNGIHPNEALECRLGASKVMYCEKCAFASVDPAAFNKHMIEHGTRFYCFYCNAMSFSEAELNEHLKQHRTKYPFKCPHCGQGYMRRLCLVKHIDRLHGNSKSQGTAKAGMTTAPPVAVSSALTSSPTADPPPTHRPVVRVAVPAPTAPAAKLGKIVDLNLTNSTNGAGERVSHLNGLIQSSRALTVSLPEEVNIPAGCLVELLEVKTVNGTKELKLRLISQQENESVVKSAKPSSPRSAGPDMLLLSTSHRPNTARSASGAFAGGRKLSEPKTAANLATKLTGNPTNVASKEKVALKRPVTEIINLECDTVVPSKVPKTIPAPAREASSGVRVTQASPVNHVSSSSSVMSGRAPVRLGGGLRPVSVVAKAPPRVVDERLNATLDLSKKATPRRLSDSSGVQEVSSSVKLGATEVHNKSKAASKEDKDVVCLDQQSQPASTSLRPPAPPAIIVRPPVVPVSKDNLANRTFAMPRSLMKPLSVKPHVLSNHTNPKVSTRVQEVRSKRVVKDGDVLEPQSFPVISSVFSLSEQPDEGKGTIQPLVMALRGIVMDKQNSKSQAQVRNGAEEKIKAPASGQCIQLAAKNGAHTRDMPLTDKATECVKVKEEDKLQSTALTQNGAAIKKEESGTEAGDADKCGHDPALKSSTGKDPAAASPAETPDAADALQPTDKSKEDYSSRFLTISLKRVQVGVWKKSKKGFKVRVSRYKTQLPVGGLDDCTVIYPLPLKEDQPVKRPGPNQPVVVLNHPKPRACVQGPRADSLRDAGATEVTPKCQILKMRLSKGIGQSYEVMGCTVRDFP